MNTERIKELAEQAGIEEWWDSGNECREVLQEHLEKLAELIAAEEREACAKMCESLEIPDTIEGAHPDYVDGKRMAAMQCAEAIRARGNE